MLFQKTFGVWFLVAGDVNLWYIKNVLFYYHSKIQEILNSKIHLDPGVSEAGSWPCGHHDFCLQIWWQITDENLFYLWLMEIFLVINERSGNFFSLNCILKSVFIFKIILSLTTVISKVLVIMQMDFKFNRTFFHVKYFKKLRNLFSGIRWGCFKTFNCLGLMHHFSLHYLKLNFNFGSINLLHALIFLCGFYKLKFMIFIHVFRTVS